MGFFDLEQNVLTPGSIIYYEGEHNNKFEVMERNKYFYAVALKGTCSEVYNINQYNYDQFFETEKDLYKNMAERMESDLKSFKELYEVD